MIEPITRKFFGDFVADPAGCARHDRQLYAGFQLSEEFTRKVIEACDQARQKTLAAGVPVFYRDDSGIEIMEQPDGRRFEIRYIPGAPGDRNYQISRELAPAAA